jgi:hypothetical protein
MAHDPVWIKAMEKFGAQELRVTEFMTLQKIE